MNDCPDARLNPPEKPNQDAINRLAYLEDERSTVKRYMDEAEFFIDEWEALLDAYDAAIRQLRDELEGV